MREKSTVKFKRPLNFTLRVTEKMNRYTMLITVVALAVMAALVPVTSAGQCVDAKPGANFTNERYYGLWYEIGKIQTAGGAFFEKDCVCTNIAIKADPSGNEGDAIVTNSCRKNTPQGKYLNATAKLIQETVPGIWQESFFPFAPTQTYTIIYIGDDYAVEYDCESVFGLLNYCIHILSRKPTQDPGLTMKLLQGSLDMGLNSEKLDYVQTLQEGCW
ncbi:apolipoprotein D-like isoform X1 [Branchiostoma floridae x Branchiostoma japonicum]